MSGEGWNPSPPHVAVTPRASLCPGGEPLPLHDQVRQLLRRGRLSVVNVFGPRGSGKTTALRHLASVLPADGTVRLMDESGWYWPDVTTFRYGDGVMVAATRKPFSGEHVVGLEMARWGPDDVIEYLLSTRRERCASVMDRIKGSPGHELSGLPELWAVVLDEMAADASLASPADALRHFLAARLGDPYVRRLATDFCLRRLLNEGTADPIEPPGYFARFDAVLARLIAYRPVQVILAAQRVVWDLAAGTGRDHLAKRLPPDLVRGVAALAAFRAPVVGALRRLVRGCDRRLHPNAATLLHATKCGWRPEGSVKPTLATALLSGADWAGVDLCGACLSGADLSGANLCRAELDAAAAGATVFRGANLRGAWLRRIRAGVADFVGADLCCACADRGNFDGAEMAGADLSAASCRGASLELADLTGARVVAADLRKAKLARAKVARANLTGADLSGASLERVDLTAAVLDGADFSRARLREADLQGVGLRDARFHRADLSAADLTGSVLPGADLRRAALRDAGLADVDWRGADLRGADFAGASFHLGSSRSGLVGSTVPSEGSRTGFYTDDYEEKGFRPPEDLRKADLRGADLRGAKVKDCDFYLVDLRGARYTPQQARHFRRCGAIL
jgi:uncharacterized protein YjbI with pentapeptide repeats